MERHILRKGTSYCPISTSWSQWVPMLAPPCKLYRQRQPNPLIGCVSFARFLILTGLCQNLTTCFSYHMVLFRLHTCSISLPRRTPLYIDHNVTACQSTRGYQERTQNPDQQSLYNTHTHTRKHIYTYIYINLIIQKIGKEKYEYVCHIYIFMQFYFLDDTK